MRESEAPQGPPTAPGEARWLLIGNSRWHWAAPPAAGERTLRVWHTLALADAPWKQDGGTAAALPPVRAPGSALEGREPPGGAGGGLLGWAAAGPLPEGWTPPAQTRLQLAEVPLEAAPAWLGIDRALAGWWGWRLVAGPVLVADAGTVLSLTRVDGQGGFAGGRLLAGAALQLRAMATGTARLPALEPSAEAEAPAPPPWPRDTETAMRTGVLRGLAAAIHAAAQEALEEEPASRLLLTGGDSGALRSLLDPALRVELRPHLCLEALAALRPAADQPSPRSARI